MAVVQPLKPTLQSWAHDHRGVSVSRVINMYHETGDTKTPSTLIGCPGLKLFATVGDGPIRGMGMLDGVLYVVSAECLFSVSSMAVVTTIGNIPGTTRVSMASNGAQLCIVSGNKGFVYTFSTDTLVEITDVDFPGATTVVFLDGYGIFSKPDSGQFFISSTYDFTAFDALEFATAESSPDNIVALVADHRELFIFGEATTEVYYNNGNADFPFGPLGRATLEHGVVGKDAVAKLDNTIYFVAEDGLVYRLGGGFSPQSVSTYYIEQLIAATSDKASLALRTHTWKGHKFLTLFGDDFTVCYDVNSNKWHDRKSYQSDTWDYGDIIAAYDNVIVSHATNNTICTMDDSVFDENGLAMTRTLITGHSHADRNQVDYKAIELDMETGVGLTTGQGSDPQVMMRFSDDGGNQWSNEHWRDIGKKGEYDTRVIWRSMGRAPQRVLWFAVSDPVDVVIHGVYVNASPVAF